MIAGEILEVNTFAFSSIVRVKRSPKTLMIVIAITLDADKIIVLDNRIQFYMFTNISDMYTKYAI